MEANNLFELPLTLIMVKDPKIGGYTAFFKQFPDIIAEGETDKEATLNLMNTVYDVFKYMSNSKSEIEESDDCRSNIIERSYNFSTQVYA